MTEEKEKVEKINVLGILFILFVVGFGIVFADRDDSWKEDIFDNIESVELTITNELWVVDDFYKQKSFCIIVPGNIKPTTVRTSQNSVFGVLFALIEINVKQYIKSDSWVTKTNTSRAVIDFVFEIPALLKLVYVDSWDFEINWFNQTNVLDNSITITDLEGDVIVDWETIGTYNLIITTIIEWERD